VTKLTTKISDHYLDAREGVLEVKHEEEFTAGLWVKPSILGLPSTRAILTFPSGSWPGDIWVIDELGEITVIEVRPDSSSRRPFQTFKQYGEGKYPDTKTIRCKWDTRTLRDRKILNSHYGDGEPLGRWPELKSRFEKLPRDEQSIKRCFETRLTNEKEMERSPMPCLAVLRLVTSPPGRQLRQALMDDWRDLGGLGLPKEKGRIYVGGIRKSGAKAYFTAQDVTQFGPFEDDGWEKLSSDWVIKFLLGEK